MNVRATALLMAELARRFDGPPGTGWMTPDLKEAVARVSLLGRTGRPDDAAELVAFLCSPAAGWITEQVIHSDGGAGLQRVARRGGELR